MTDKKEDKLNLDTPIGIEDIDFRIQSINKGGYATILAYKDARVDIRRLNAVCGNMGWKREHTRDNRNCVVSLWDKEEKHWVSKEDTGTESNTEQQKGLASDSFKRACFNWGIGLELYDYPVIQVKLNGGGNTPKGCEWYLNENKKDKWNNPSVSAGYDLKLKQWVWYSQFDDGKVSYLSAIDQNGTLRFESGHQATAHQIAPEPVDRTKVEWSANQYRELMDADVDVVDFKRMQKIDAKLTNDERVETKKKLGNAKHSCGRFYRTLLDEYLKMKPEDLVDAKDFQAPSEAE